MAESAPPLRGGRAIERRRERETEQQCSDMSVCTSEAATLLLSNLSLLSLLLVEPRIISRTGSCWDREQRCTLYIVQSWPVFGRVLLLTNHLVCNKWKIRMHKMHFLPQTYIICYFLYGILRIFSNSCCSLFTGSITSLVTTCTKYFQFNRYLRAVFHINAVPYFFIL